MPFGINLSELLRAGTEAGLGHFAGKDAAREQQRRRTIEEQQRALEDALTRARTFETATRGVARLQPPEPRRPTNQDIEGMVLGAMGEGSTDEEILAALPEESRAAGRAALENIRNRRATAGRAESSQERSAAAAESRTMQAQLNAFASEMALAPNSDFESTKASLQQQFPDAPEHMVITAAVRAHDQGDSLEAILQSILIRELVNAGVLGGPGGS